MSTIFSSPTLYTLEFQLILSLLRTFINKEKDSELDRLVSRSPSQTLFLKLAHQHQVISHLFESFKYIDPDSPISSWKKKLLFHKQAITISAFEKIQALLQIHKVLTQAEIPFICLKGPLLSLQVFSDPTFRFSSDLDIWIERKNLSKIKLLLESLNFSLLNPSPDFSNEQLECYYRSHKDIMFRLPNLPVTLEVHYGHHVRQGVGQIEKTFPLEKSIRLKNCDFFVLPDESNLLYLIEHGVKHTWASMRWLLDIVPYTKQFGDKNPLRAHIPNPYVQEAHFLSQSLLKTDLLPISIKPRLRIKLALKLVDQVLAIKSNSKRTQPFLSYHWLSLYHLLCLNSSYSFLVGILKTLVMPREYDINFLRIPKHLFFLHYLIRPIFILTRLIKQVKT